MRAALAFVLDAAGPAASSVDFRVVGTAAALLQGVDVPTGDVDVLFRDRTGVDAFGSALGVEASWLAEGRQYFARVAVDGVELELSTVEWEASSDASECVGTGPWRNFEIVRCGGRDVPVVRLELRLATELARDRADRYRPLLERLAAKGYDADLLRRALAAAGASDHPALEELE